MYKYTEIPNWRAFVPILAALRKSEANAVICLLVLKSMNKSGKHLFGKSGKIGLKEEYWTLNEKERKQVAEIMNCTTRSVDNHIKKLFELDLVKWGEWFANGNRQLAVSSHDRICQRYGLWGAGASRKKIKPSSVDLRSIIIKLAIELKVSECKEANKFYREHTPEVRENLPDIVGSAKPTSESIESRQIDVLIKGERAYDLSKEDADILLWYSCDFNIGYKCLKTLLGRKSGATIAYIKRKLTSEGVCYFEHRKLKADHRLYTSLTARNGSVAERYGRLFYDKNALEPGLYLCLPDKITFNNHNSDAVKKDVLRIREMLKEQFSKNAKIAA